MNQAISLIGVSWIIFIISFFGVIGSTLLVLQVTPSDRPRLLMAMHWFICLLFAFLMLTWIVTLGNFLWHTALFIYQFSLDLPEYIQGVSLSLCQLNGFPLFFILVGTSLIVVRRIVLQNRTIKAASFAGVVILWLGILVGLDKMVFSICR